jgi:predicted enzyme related to lactoylglutathione lyase
MTFKLAEAFVALAAMEFDRLVAFYQQLLEQSPDRFVPNVYAEFQLPGLKFGIFRPKHPTASDADSPHRTIGMSLCLEVANLDAAISHLTALGYPPPGKILTASHGREVYAYDPEGNWLILHQSSSDSMQK